MSENVSEDYLAQYDIKATNKKKTYIINRQITQTSSDKSVIYRYSHKQRCFIRTNEAQRVQFHFSFDGPYLFGGNNQIVSGKRDIFNIQNKSVQTDNIQERSVRIDTEQKIIQQFSGSFSRSQIYDAYFAKKPAATPSPAELAEQARWRQARLLDALVLAETLLCERAAPPSGFLAVMNTISPPKYDYWAQHYIEAQKIDDFSASIQNFSEFNTEKSDTNISEAQDRTITFLGGKSAVNTIDLSDQNLNKLQTALNALPGTPAGLSDTSLKRIETLQLQKNDISQQLQHDVPAGIPKSPGLPIPHGTKSIEFPALLAPNESMSIRFTNNMIDQQLGDITRQTSFSDVNTLKTQTTQQVIRQPPVTAVFLGTEYLVAFGALLQVYSRLNTFHAAFKHHFAQEITCICQMGAETCQDEMNAGLILVGLRDGNLVLLDRNLQQLDEEHFHEGAISAVKKKPGTNLFVSVCMGGVISFSRVTDGKIYLIYQTELPGIQILSLFLARKHFAVGTDQGTIVLFEYYRKTQICQFSAEDGLSPTFFYGIGEIAGELVVCGEDGVVRSVIKGSEIFMADQPLYSIYGLKNGRALLQGQNIIFLLQSKEGAQHLQADDKKEERKDLERNQISTSSINVTIGSTSLKTGSIAHMQSIKQDQDEELFQAFDVLNGVNISDLLQEDALSILIDSQANQHRPDGLENTQQIEILDFIEVSGMTRITVNVEDDIALIGTTSGGVKIIKIGQDLELNEQLEKKHVKKQKENPNLRQNKSKAAILGGHLVRQEQRSLLPNAGTHDLLVSGPNDVDNSNVGESTTTGSMFISRSIFTRVL